MAANVESMFYVEEMPWHRQGIKLTEPPDSAEAIRCAGLDWQVSKVALRTVAGTPVFGHYGIVRDDSNTVLGVVKEGYTLLQNRDAFAFFDPLIESEFLEYETAGALGEGEIVWILAKIKKEPTFSVCANDEVTKYLLLSNSHDGLSAVNVKFTPIRVVCQNTLNLALDRDDTTRIKHIASVHSRLSDLRVAVQDILRVYKGAENNFKAMYNRKMSAIETWKYFNDLYPIAKEGSVLTESQYKTREKNIRAKNLLMDIYESEYNGIFGIRGSLWAAYNAVTQYVDHPYNYRLGDNRLLKRIWFGEGEANKVKAYAEALKLLNKAVA